MAASAFVILQEGFALARENYVPILGLYLLLMAAFTVVLIAVAILAVLAFFAVGAAAAAIFALLLMVAVILIMGPIWIGSYYSIALQSSKGGSVSARYAIGQALQKWKLLVWTMLLESLIIIAIDILIFSPLIISMVNLLGTMGASGPGGAASPSISTLVSSLLPLIWLALFLVMVFLVANAVLSPLLYEAVPLTMLENVSGMAAIKESLDVGKKYFWSLLGLIAGVIAIASMVGVAQSAIVFMVSLASRGLSYLVDIVLSVLVGAFMAAWFTALPILFYKDYLEGDKTSKRKD